MRLLVLALVACSLLVMPVFGGKIVINNDEWTMAAGSPNAGPFAANVANWFSPGGPGTFLVYTANFGLDNATFTGALNGAGHSVIVNTSLPAFDLPTLSGYTGIFMGGYLGDYDAAVLTSYVNGGGNVYLMAGTGTAGDEGTVWDSFLNNFGFQFGPSYNGISVTQPITSGHPIFSGIDSLFFANGNSIYLYGLDPYASILEESGHDALIGVYDNTDAGAVPEPATLGGAAVALLAVAGLRRRVRA